MIGEARRPRSSLCVAAAVGRQTDCADRPCVAYDLPFWLAYASTTLAVAATAILFRYADFITLLGGTEFHLGWIVGVGMVGSLAMRLSLGSCIDSYGTKVVWLGSTLLFAATCCAHLAIASHTGAAIYLLRILFCCAIAGFYGAAMTFVTSRAPTNRMAELAGMLGTASFLGTVLGTMLGDLLLESVAVNRAQVVTMFLAAGVMGLCSCPFACLATRSEMRPERLPHSPLLGVLQQHHPGAVLVVGVAMGMGASLPAVFLCTYAAEIQIPRISMFFTAFAVAAIVARVVTRRWPERFGNRPIILLGMTGMGVGMAMFLLVRTEWQLALPGIGLGCFYAIIFPPVLAVGVAAFPARHRGLATLLVLATLDLGQLVGAPIAGAVLEYSSSAGLPPYPTMFLTMAALLVLVGVWYVACCDLVAS
jgi:MFS family permease